MCDAKMCLQSRSDLLILVEGNLIIRGGWMGGVPMSHVDYKKW